MRSDGTKKSPVRMLVYLLLLAAVWHTPGLRRPGWRWGVTLYAILIMVSTVFVKQQDVYKRQGVECPFPQMDVHMK